MRGKLGTDPVIECDTEPKSKVLSKMVFKSGISLPGNRKNQVNLHLLALALLSTIQLLSLTGYPRGDLIVHCQGFEDLNSNSNVNRLPTQHSGQLAHQARNHLTGSRHLIQRPSLGSRFASANQVSGQNLLAQASSSASVFSEPPHAPTFVSAPAFRRSDQQAVGVSNIEQMMKNALSRTSQVNQVASEPRPDIVSPVATTLHAHAGSPSESVASRAASSQQQQSSVTTKQPIPDKLAEESDSVATEARLEKGDDKSTTTLDSQTTNGHETVYSEQRFANLFAPRKNPLKTRLLPTEQVKAKPTLPAFIKSPPDPKQFSGNQAGSIQDNRPIAPLLSSNSQRIQQQQQLGNQNRINLANQQRKPVITSNSAAIASNKRTATLNNVSKPSTSPSSSPKASSSNSKSTTSKPVLNNPFNRSQGSSNDPAAVIAMARKRLLANNALESAKLKQEQNKQTN